MVNRNRRLMKRATRFAEVKTKTVRSGQSKIYKESSVEISFLASNAFRKAALSAMRTSGFLVVVENDWVVKKYPNGQIERISPIEKIKRPETIVL